MILSSRILDKNSSFESLVNCAGGNLKALGVPYKLIISVLSIRSVFVSNNLRSVFVSYSLRSVFVSYSLRSVFVSYSLRSVFVSYSLRSVFISYSLRSVFVSYSLRSVFVSYSLRSVFVCYSLHYLPRKYCCCLLCNLCLLAFFCLETKLFSQKNCHLSYLI